MANANQHNQINAATAVSNFTSVTDVSPGGSVLGQAFQTNPAQLYPGQMWRFTANGIWSSTSSPGISLGVYYGGAAGSPLCYGSVAVASAISGAASTPWSMTAFGKVVAVGASTGQWQVIGTLSGLNGLSGANTMMPVYTSVAQYNTASPQIITVAATCTASVASNAVTVYNWAIEYMTEP